MSAEAVAALPSASANASLRARRAALRLGFGVAASFTVVEALNWDLTFLAPVLAAQLLVGSRRAPGIAQGLAFPIVIGLAVGIVLLLSTALVAMPPLLVLALALVLFLSFYGQLRGAPDFAMLMVQISAVMIPVFAVISPALAAHVAGTFFNASIVALLTVWVAHAAFPDPDADVTAPRAGAGPMRLPASTAVKTALCNTLIVMPILIWYLIDEAQIAVVLLITIVTVVRAYDPNMGQRAAMGLIVGNLIGGLAAVLAHALIETTETIVFFALVCLAASLLFAGRIVTAGTLAPLLVAAFFTFIILLGIGVSPLPGGSGGAFTSRLFYVLLATAYAIGAIALLRPPALSRQERASSA